MKILSGSVNFFVAVAAVVGGVAAVLSIVPLVAGSSDGMIIDILETSNRRLVSNEVNAPIDIFFNDSKVLEPWLLSFRLENSGSETIETRDIESYPTLDLQDADIVSVEFGEGNDHGILVNLDLKSESKIEIKHSLLNPGEWFTFDVILDGEPVVLEPSARISGLEALNLLSMPESSAPEASVTWVELPRSVTSVVLGVAVSVSGAMVLAALGLIVVAAIPNNFEADLDEFASIILLSSPVLISASQNTDVAAAKNLLSDYGTDLEWDWVDDPGASPPGFEDSERDALRLLWKAAMARYAWRRLPAGPDERVEKRILDLPHQGVSLDDLVPQAAEVLGEFGEHTPRYSMSDLMLGVAGVLTLFVGVSLALVVGGAWVDF